MKQLCMYGINSETDMYLLLSIWCLRLSERRAEEKIVAVNVACNSWDFSNCLSKY